MMNTREHCEGCQTQNKCECCGHCTGCEEGENSPVGLPQHGQEMTDPMRQLTKVEAILFFENCAYKNMTYRQKAEFQMMQDKLCMPFRIFHEAITEALGRPVYTHEFGLNRAGLMDELFNGAEAPTLDEIIEMIPPEMRFILEKKQ